LQVLDLKFVGGFR